MMPSTKESILVLGVILSLFALTIFLVLYIYDLQDECHEKGGAYLHGQCVKAEVIPL